MALAEQKTATCGPIPDAAGFSLRVAKPWAVSTMRQDLQWGAQRSTGLVDVLDRVLDKGLVIAGDIKISLAEVELLTIRIRLIVCSIDKAEQVGLDWWKYDHHLAPGKQPLMAENESLRKQIQILERKVAQLAEDNVAVRRRTVDAPQPPAGSSFGDGAPKRRAPASKVPAGPAKRRR
jgi:hypothetical protein